MEFILQYADKVGPFFVAIILLYIILRDSKKKKDTPADLAELIVEVKDVKTKLGEIKVSQFATESLHKDVQSVSYSMRNNITNLHELLTEKDDDGTYRWWNKQSIEKQINETHNMVKQLKGNN